MSDIPHMHAIDDSGLDTILLRTLVTVYEEGSVSKAAVRLGVNQSTLSHRLERLRAILGDPIFVRAGRGISPTPRADEVIAEAVAALAAIRRIVEPGSFDPRDINRRFVIAATDYERALFLLEAHKQILTVAPGARLQFVWDQYDNSEQLKAGQIDLAIAPTPTPTGNNIRKTDLFHDKVVCFFDPRMIAPPDTLDQYASAKHLRVTFSVKDASFVDSALRPLGLERDVATDLPSISEAPRVMRGAPLIATLPLRLKDSIMREFAYCKVPFDMPRLTYSMFWHERTAASPEYAWLRAHLLTSARQLTD